MTLLYDLPSWIWWSVTVFALIIGVLLHTLTKNSRYILMIDKLPGPKNILFFNPLLSFLFASKEDWFMMMVKLTENFKHVPLSRYWIGYKPVVLLYDAAAIEMVMNSQKLIDKGPTYNLLHAWLGRGLLTSTGEKWRNRRKLITPSFHFRILDDFFKVFVDQADILVDTFKGMQGKGYCDVAPYLANCTLDVICETTMGIRLRAQKDTGSEFVKAVNHMGEIMTSRRMMPWLESDLVFNLTSLGRFQRKCLNTLHRFTEKVIQDRWAEVSSDGSKLSSPSTDEMEYIGQKKRLALLDMLLEIYRDTNKLDFKDIREEVDTFMFEGHDTTATGLAWMLYNVGRFPEIQEKLHKELDAVFGRSNRPMQKEDLAELKYLELVIKESLRMFPPVPFLTRQTTENMELRGYTIPAGTEIVFYIYTIHRNEKYFPDPDRFDPDRFLPENCVNRHPFAYIPFSAGPRNCIGQKFAMMEIKTVMCQILRNFKVSSKSMNNDFQITTSFVLRPSNGMWLKLENRQ